MQKGAQQWDGGRWAWPGDAGRGGDGDSHLGALWEGGTGHQPYIQVSQKNNATPHTMAKGRELLPLKYILHLTHSFQEFVIAFNQTLLDDGSWLRLHF